MKICLINNLYGQFGRGGGAEQVTEIFAKELVGHEVFTISTKPRSFKSEIHSRDYYLNGLFPNLAKLPIWLRLFWHVGNIFSWRKAGQIKKILQIEKPDLVITHNLMGLGFLTPRVIQKLKIPHVHVLHDLQLLHPSGTMFWGEEEKLNSLPAKIYMALNRWCFQRPNLVLSPSQWLLDLHLNHGLFTDTKTKYLLNPQTSQVPELSEVIETKGNYFLFVGQLAEHKGIKLLLEVFEELNRGAEKFSLKIVGAGALLATATAVAKNCPEIEVLGLLPNPEVHQLMSRAQCLVIPSLAYENSPTVILEALKNKLPVLGVDFGGVAELLPSKFLLFAPDKASLRERVMAAQQEPEKLREEFEKIRQRIHQPSVMEYFAEIKKELW